jgi:hypothetical protein
VPLEFYGLPEGSGCRFWDLNHEMLLVEMLERSRIRSSEARREIEPQGKSGMQTHLLASHTWEPCQIETVHPLGCQVLKRLPQSLAELIQCFIGKI